MVDGISAVTLQSPDPVATAARWAAILETDVVDGTVALDNATVHFVQGPVDSLVAVAVTGPRPSPTPHLRRRFHRLTDRTRDGSAATGGFPPSRGI